MKMITTNINDYLSISTIDTILPIGTLRSRFASDATDSVPPIGSIVPFPPLAAGSVGLRIGGVVNVTLRHSVLRRAESMTVTTLMVPVGAVEPS